MDRQLGSAANAKPDGSRDTSGRVFFHATRAAPADRGTPKRTRPAARMLNMRFIIAYPWARILSQLIT